MSALIQEIKGSVARAFDAADLETDPSPHALIDGLLTSAYYSDLLAHLPPEDAYGAMAGRTNNPRALNARKTFNLADPGNIAALPADRAAFWSAMRQVFMSSWFAQRAISLFVPVLAAQRPDLNEDTAFTMKLELLRDRQGYGLDPHTDVPGKVMTLLYYLPRPDDPITLGTSFYRPRAAGFTCQRGVQYPADQFIEVKRAPFAANTALTFLRTDRSFHGVPPMTDDGVERNLMRWMLFRRDA